MALKLSQVNRLTWLVILAAVLAVTALGVPTGWASAQAIPPTRFFGVAFVDNLPAAPGATVRAFIGGTLCASATVDAQSGYMLDVPSASVRAGCGVNGRVVTFTIEGLPAAQSGTWQAGAFVRLNLASIRGGPPPPPSTVQVTYQPGWNLVAGPRGMTFPQASGPLYTFQAGDRAYRVQPSTTGVLPGRGYWAFFSRQTIVTLSGAASGIEQVAAPAGQWVMIGNPGYVDAAVTGADAVFVWDALRGVYAPATRPLRPGQGAWAISYRGGTITISALLQ